MLGLSKAISDTLQHHYPISIFVKNNSLSFFGSHSWKRKKKFELRTDLVGKLLNWFYQNTFVLLSDAWHFFNSLNIISLLLAMYFVPKSIIAILIFYSVRTLTFHIFYTYILITKNKNNKKTINK